MDLTECRLDHSSLINEQPFVSSSFMKQRVLIRTDSNPDSHAQNYRTNTPARVKDYMKQ